MQYHLSQLVIPFSSLSFFRTFCIVLMHLLDTWHHQEILFFSKISKWYENKLNWKGAQRYRKCNSIVSQQEDACKSESHLLLVNDLPEKKKSYRWKGKRNESLVEKGDIVWTIKQVTLKIWNFFLNIPEAALQDAFHKKKLKSFFVGCWDIVWFMEWPTIGDFFSQNPLKSKKITFLESARQAGHNDI